MDYLVVSHLEPDHAGSIGRLVELFPEVTLVGNAKTFHMLPQFFDELPVDENHKITVAELGALSMDNNSAPVAVPDFTRGHWNELKGYSHAYASPEDEAAAEKAAKEFTAGMKAGGEKFLKKYWKTETQKNKKAAKKAK